MFSRNGRRVFLMSTLIISNLDFILMANCPDTRNISSPPYLNIGIILFLKSHLHFYLQYFRKWFPLLNLFRNLLNFLVFKSQLYTRSLAPADFSGAVFTHTHFQKMAQKSSLSGWSLCIFYFLVRMPHNLDHIRKCENI